MMLLVIALPEWPSLVDLQDESVAVHLLGSASLHRHVDRVRVNRIERKAVRGKDGVESVDIQDETVLQPLRSFDRVALAGLMRTKQSRIASLPDPTQRRF